MPTYMETRKRTWQILPAPYDLVCSTRMQLQYLRSPGIYVVLVSSLHKYLHYPTIYVTYMTAHLTHKKSMKHMRCAQLNCKSSHSQSLKVATPDSGAQSKGSILLLVIQNHSQKLRPYRLLRILNVKNDISIEITLRTVYGTENTIPEQQWFYVYPEKYYRKTNSFSFVDRIIFVISMYYVNGAQLHLHLHTQTYSVYVWFAFCGVRCTLPSLCIKFQSEDCKIMCLFSMQSPLLSGHQLDQIFRVS